MRPIRQDFPGELVPGGPLEKDWPQVGGLLNPCVSLAAAPVGYLLDALGVNRLEAFDGAGYRPVARLVGPGVAVDG